MGRFTRHLRLVEMGNDPARRALAGPAVPAHLSVRDVLQRAAAVLQRTLPAEVWIRGEVVGYKGPKGGGHWFDLVDRRDGQRDAVLCAVVWHDRWQAIRSKLDAAGVELAEGQEMLFRGNVRLYEGGGRLTFHVTDVYPELTLGQIEQRRRRILERLQREQLLEVNKRLPLSEVPLRVGLVSSTRADGMQDFQWVLGRSGYGFTVIFQNVPVQGRDMEPAVCAALELFARSQEKLRLDVLCLVRGGGSATDLSWWNSYPIAAAVARMPVPVISGIGHDPDRVVIDDVAHTRSATPTAAAEFLVRRVRESEAALADARRSVAELAGAGLTRQRDGLAGLRLSVADLTTAAWANGKAAYRNGLEQLQALAGQALRAEARSQEECRRTVALQARVAIERASCRVGELAEQVQAAAGAQVRARERDRQCVRDNLADAVARAAAQAEGRLSQLRELVEAHDPQRVLRRGYSITRDASGRAIRDAAQVAPGAEVVTMLARGSLCSRVTEANQPPDGEAS